MKHYYYLGKEKRKEIFYKAPQRVNVLEKETLSLALGALLYMPANKKNWADDVINGKHEGLTSMVLDLEDALKDSDIEEGVQVIIEGFKDMEKNRSEIPFIFIRVRYYEQMELIVKELGKKVNYLTGFILPKFDTRVALIALSELRRINSEYNLHLYGMPILESSHIMYKEMRIPELLKLKEIVDVYKDIVLNIRVGATDFTSLFGIRRTVDNTVYDMSVIRDCLVDIVNIFGRAEDGYVISGPVWEFFEGKNRILKPQLREHLFEARDKSDGRDLEFRKYLINEYVDGLIKEILMDKINGFNGKTIIHPSHIKPVNSLLAVSYEEYVDAKAVVEGEDSSGVLKSEFSNKMNEVKPHLNWANKIMNRSKIYGVLNKDRSFVDLL
jgi:citrate lyase beta subunit